MWVGRWVGTYLHMHVYVHVHMVTSTVNCPKIMKKQGVFTHLCHSDDLPALIGLIFLKKKSLSTDLLKCVFLWETEGGHPENLRGILSPETKIWVLGYNVFSSQNLEFSVIFAF